MDNQKEIEEMAKIIATAKNCKALALSECINRDCKIKKEYGCRSYFQAETLYNAGYGNVKEALKKFAERIKMAFYYEFDELIPSIMSDKIDELIKEVCGE